MAVYTYKCTCGQRFEARMPMPGEDVCNCPFCGQKARRVPSLVNFTFGWRLSDESHLKGHPDEFVRDV